MNTTTNMQVTYLSKDFVKYKVTREIAAEALALVDHGLVKGIGTQVPGRMCVEACWCAVFGMPHDDNPPCVGPAVRSFKIALNDCNWSSPAARAKGLRRIAVAQAGSDQIDQMAWTQEVLLQGVKLMLPALLPEDMGDDIRMCGRVTTYQELAAELPGLVLRLDTRVQELRNDLTTSSCAERQVYLGAFNRAGMLNSVVSYHMGSRNCGACFIPDALNPQWETDRIDERCTQLAEIGVQALIKLGCEGTEWLDLCDEPPKGE